MSDLFTEKPDFTSYSAVPIDPRLFDPQKALDPFDEKFTGKLFRSQKRWTVQKLCRRGEWKMMKTCGRIKSPKIPRVWPIPKKGSANTTAQSLLDKPDYLNTSLTKAVV